MSSYELGASLGPGLSGSLAKYTRGLVSHLVGSKLPGGFNSSAVKSHLLKTRGLGPSRSDAVLLLGTTMEPPKRLKSEPEIGWGRRRLCAAVVNSELNKNNLPLSISNFTCYLKRDSRSGEIAFDPPRPFKAR